MAILFYLTILLFSLGQLGRVSFFNQQINGYLYEIPLFLTLLYLLWRFRLEPIRKGLKHFKVIFWFIFILFFSYLLNFFRFSLFQNLVAFLYLTRLIIYLTYGGYLGYWVVKNPPFRKTLINGIYFLSGLILISSFIQYFLYPDLRNLLYLGWDPHLNRMFGTFFDTSTAAAVYGLFFLYWYKTRNLIFLLFFLVSVVLTFSRSTYIVLTLSVIWYLFSQKRFFVGLVFLTTLISLILAAPKPFGEGINLRRTFSIEARLDDYKQAIGIWRKSPLFGIGYNRIRFVKPNLEANHAASSFSSSYLIVLVAGGILGMLGFFGVLWKLWLVNKRTRTMALFLIMLSFTDNIILHPFIMFLLGTIIVVSLTLPSDK